MSYLSVRQTLIKRLQDAAIVPNKDVVLQNDGKDPSSKKKFIAAYYIPADEESTGKTQESSDYQTGTFQISAFVRKDTHDKVLLQLVDDIKAAFQTNTQTVYNNQVVHITGLSVNAGSENESWFKRDVSINYSAFTARQ